MKLKNYLFTNWNENIFLIIKRLNIQNFNLKLWSQIWNGGGNDVNCAEIEI